MNKWIKVTKPSGSTLVLMGPGGVTRIETLGKYSEGRKSGFNTELFNEKHLVCYAKETFEEIEMLLELISYEDYALNKTAQEFLDNNKS